MGTSQRNWARAARMGLTTTADLSDVLKDWQEDRARMQRTVDELRAELAALRADFEAVAGVDLPETGEAE